MFLTGVQSNQYTIVSLYRSAFNDNTNKPPFLMHSKCFFKKQIFVNQDEALIIDLSELKRNGVTHFFQSASMFFYSSFECRMCYLIHKQALNQSEKRALNLPSTTITDTRWTATKSSVSPWKNKIFCILDFHLA